MIRIIGVRFRHSGKTYYFDPLDIEVSNGDHVVVETAKGMDLGQIKLGPMEVEEYQVTKALKPIVRKATEEDLAKVERGRQKEEESLKVCQEKARQHELDMKVVGAEYAFDGSKLLFYFTADGRVDFRELVKDLASTFHTRIELRQIGVRDETKMMGGIGICGRELCCTTYLSDFVPVSIKMAKEQNLSLNPTKISGMCGRLMCCLKNEEETYEYLNETMPKVGDTAVLADGTKGEVESVNILRQQIRVVYMNEDTKERLECSVDDVEIIPRKKGTPRMFDRQGRTEQSKKAEAEGRGQAGENAGDAQQKDQRAGRGSRRRNDSRTENGSEGRENRENKGENRSERRNDHRNGHRNDHRDDHRKNPGEEGAKEAEPRNEGQTAADGENREKRSHRSRGHRSRNHGQNRNPEAQTAGSNGGEDHDGGQQG